MTGAPRLPPLNALRVFHTVVRHRSFRAAAEELRVSPQAVSQQIRLLEETLGCALFDRRGRVIIPNEQAILLAHSVQAAFDELTEGVRRISRARPRNRINLNASPHFATRHLLARLDRLRAALPQIDLRLTITVDLPDFAADGVDAAVQWGFGQWSGLEAQLLLGDAKDLCCSPALARRLTTPADLLSQALLHPVLSDDLWPNVLAHLGVTGAVPRPELRFHDAAALRQATLAGAGVGLVSTLDAEEDLASGRLVAPFGRGVMAGMAPSQVPGFYLVLPRAHRRVAAIAAFCHWVEAEDWSHPLEEPRPCPRP